MQIIYNLCRCFFSFNSLTGDQHIAHQNIDTQSANLFMISASGCQSRSRSRNKSGPGKSRSRSRDRKIFAPELQDFGSEPKREIDEISFFYSMSVLSNARGNIKVFGAAIYLSAIQTFFARKLAKKLSIFELRFLLEN